MSWHLLYFLWTTINHEFALIDFKDSQHRLAKFFIENQGDGKFLHFTTPAGIAQEGYTRENIVATDYLSATISIPLFSQRFVDKEFNSYVSVSDSLKQMVEEEGLRIHFLQRPND